MNPLDSASSVERYLCDRAVDTQTPINGSLELLPLCNMNCDMCYVRLSKEEMDRLGRMRTVEEWLAIGRQMKEAGVLFLLLTGGEPLLFPDFQKLYLGLKEMGMILTINTNATLITEEMAAFFGKHKPRRINITLYGKDEAAYADLCHFPGGFARTVQGIRLLRKYGVDVKISSSMTRSNANDWEEIIALGKELDAPVRIDCYMYPAVRERSLPYPAECRLEPEEAAQLRVKVLRAEMGDELFQKYALATLQRKADTLPGEYTPGKVHCMAGRCSFTVNWQGLMRPCVVMTTPEANVFTLGFREAWEQIWAATDAITTNPQCSVCTYRNVCQTCAACAMAEEGAFDALPAYMCRSTKETISALEKDTAEGAVECAAEETMQPK